MSRLSSRRALLVGRTVGLPHAVCVCFGDAHAPLAACAFSRPGAILAGPVASRLPVCRVWHSGCARWSARCFHRFRGAMSSGVARAPTFLRAGCGLAVVLWWSRTRLAPLGVWRILCWLSPGPMLPSLATSVASAAVFVPRRLRSCVAVLVLLPAWQCRCPSLSKSLSKSCPVWWCLPLCACRVGDCCRRWWSLWLPSWMVVSVFHEFGCLVD